MKIQTPVVNTILGCINAPVQNGVFDDLEIICTVHGNSSMIVLFAFLIKLIFVNLFSI